MGNLSSKSTALSAGFQLFPHLPAELQRQIWQYAADAWIHSFVDYMWYWTSPSANGGNRIFLLFIDVDMGRIVYDIRNWSYILQFPALFFVNTASRNVMYDAMLGFKTKEVPRGEDIHLFIKCAGGHKDYLNNPRLYGWRIQDFRYPGLHLRIQAENDRLREMGEEMAEIEDKIKRFKAGTLQYVSGQTEGEAVQLKPRSEEYVRLPLFNEDGATYRNANGRVMHDLYGAMPKMECRAAGDRDYKP